MANKNVPDIPSRKLKSIVASPGQFMETLREYSGSSVVVLPHGMDWSPVIENEDTLEAIITMPFSHTSELTTRAVEATHG